MSRRPTRSRQRRGASVVGQFSQSRRAPDMATYIGPGKVDDLKAEIAAWTASE